MAQIPRGGRATVAIPRKGTNQPTQTRLPTDGALASGSSTIDYSAQSGCPLNTVDTPRHSTAIPVTLHHHDKHVPKDTEKFDSVSLDNAGLGNPVPGNVGLDTARADTTELDSANLNAVNVDDDVDLDNLRDVDMNSANLLWPTSRNGMSPIDYGLLRAETSSTHSSLEAHGRSNPSPSPPPNHSNNKNNSDVDGHSGKTRVDVVLEGVGKWV